MTLHTHPCTYENCHWPGDAPDAERIAAAIESEEARLYRLCPSADDWVTADYRAGMLRAARIARGGA